MDSYRRSAIFTLRNLKLRITPRDLLVTFAIIAAASLIAFFVRPWKGEVTGALVFMLGITVAGAACGLAAAITAALGAFVLYNFYFAEPVLTFRIATGADIAPLIVFNLCAIITGVLAGRLRDYGETADRSNAQFANLLEISRALQVSVRLPDIQAALSRASLSSMGFAAWLFHFKGDMLVPAETTLLLPPPPVMPAMLGEMPFATIHGGGSAVYRLDGSNGAVGMMVVKAENGILPDPAFLTAFANIVALAVERASLIEAIAESRAAARTEELKSALLASVSHDFRTPLTTISASASSLIDYQDQLDRNTALKLLGGISDECERLNRYTGNLLELSRLETGLTPAHFQTLSVPDLINSAILRSRSRLGDRRVCRRFPEADMLIKADTALFELALVNILDNACLYSEDGSRIIVECGKAGDDCLIAIADEGRGIPAWELDRVFERFYRSSEPRHGPPGSGLGLAIVKGFVEALGGSVGAVTPGIDGTGSKIIVRIPLAEEAITP